MIFWTGKHKGKSFELVRKIEPTYIPWCEANAPWMLKEKKFEPKQIIVKPKEQGSPVRKEVPEESEAPKSSLQPNLDFLSQKGDYQLYKKDEDDKS